MTGTPPPLAKISDYVAWYAEATPAAEALVLGDRRLSYADLDAAVDALSRALIAAGVQPGDRVATLQTPSPDYLIAFLATSAIGAIWMGLNPKYRAAELDYVVSDARPCILLTRLHVGARDYQPEIAAMRAASPELRQVVAFDGATTGDIIGYDAFIADGRAVSDTEIAARRAAAGGRQPCLIVYTSGSTGRPKGAVLHHEGIVRFSIEQNRLWPVAPYRSLNFLPINHVGCTVDLATPCLVAGGAMIFMEQFDAAESVRIIARERISFIASVPSVFALQIATPEWAVTDFSSVQLMVWEGAAISADVLLQLAAKCARLATNYGMTETTSAITALAPITLAPADDPDVLLSSVGHPFPGVEVCLADETGAAVPDGAVGEIHARSPLNFLHYWNRPEDTAAAFTPDGFFRTGDLAERRADGRLRIVGRLKDMFKSGGYNVYPREVEEVIESHPAVALAAVVPMPDPLWQEAGVAFVVPRPGMATTPDEIIVWCRDRLANYKVPKQCAVREALPLLPIGKIDKVALRDEAAGSTVDSS
ncbi:class I adenylate-forming enzyme family protein [Sphingobium algorifonticola]|nr:AMP-binding protein [Sphingobium algorifonticola]